MVTGQRGSRGAAPLAPPGSSAPLLGRRTGPPAAAAAPRPPSRLPARRRWIPPLPPSPARPPRPARPAVRGLGSRKRSQMPPFCVQDWEHAAAAPAAGSHPALPHLHLQQLHSHPQVLQLPAEALQRRHLLPQRRQLLQHRRGPRPLLPQVARTRRLLQLRHPALQGRQVGHLGEE